MHKLFLLSSLLFIPGSVLGMLNKANQLSQVFKKTVQVRQRTRRLIRQSLPIALMQKRLYCAQDTPRKQLQEKLASLKESRKRSLWLTCGINFPIALCNIALFSYVDNSWLLLLNGFFNCIMNGVSINRALKDANKIRCIEKQLRFC